METGMKAPGDWQTPDGEPLWTAAQLAQGLAAGEVTSRQLTQEALARAGRGEGGRAFTRLYREWAPQLALASDQLRKAGVTRSPAEGLTVSIKDLFDVKGETTCAGSAVLRDTPPARRHAKVVEKLLRAGAVLAGRTNMTEFAYSGLGLNPHYGTPANPWQRGARLIPGGSSSGAAVSVSDGMCAAAIGSDTGGSIRIPAALCGLTGFKPTACRVSREGMLPLSEALDSIGVIAHDVASCVLLDAVIADAPVALAERGLRRARFAVPDTVVLDGMDDTVARTFERALDVLRRQGAEIEFIDIPEFAELDSLNARGGFNAAEAWAWHEKLLQSREAEYDPRVASRMRRGQGFLASDWLALVRARKQWGQAVARRIASYDAVLMPTVPMVAPRIRDLETDENLYFACNAAMLRNPTFINFLDGCALSLPCQLPGEAPVGLSVAASRMRDEQIVQWAWAIERALRASH